VAGESINSGDVCTRPRHEQSVAAVDSEGQKDKYTHARISLTRF
jgi:hypothetical protein